MLSRRAFLGVGAVASGAVVTACSHTSSPSTASSGKNSAVERVTYGSDPSQFGELSRPSGNAKGTVVIIHGGFWMSQYGLDLGRLLAADLVLRGYACWNLEYRRVGDGGGWPATFADVAAGIDHLAMLDVDTRKVVAVGHSAGGHLAAWAAGRGKLPADAPGGRPAFALSGIVSQAGVLDLATAAATNVGGGAVVQFLGSRPEGQPERYRVADPIEQVPIAAPVLCVHSQRDGNVPYAQSTAYVIAATKAGGAARLHETKGDHFTLIDPASAAWAVVREALPDLLAGRLPG